MENNSEKFTIDQINTVLCATYLTLNKLKPTGNPEAQFVEQSEIMLATQSLIVSGKVKDTAENIDTFYRVLRKNYPGDLVCVVLS